MRRMYSFSQRPPSLFLVLASLATVIVGGQAQADNVEVKFATPCYTPNNEVAYCIEIQQCALFLKQLVERKNDTFEFLLQSRCGPENENPSKPKVCCGTTVHFNNPVRTTTVTPEPSTSFPTVPPRGQSPLPKQCGKQMVSLANRIVGGIKADLGEFPWLVRLRHKNRFNYTGIGCAGLLIHRRYVLTAAHCLQPKVVQPLGPVFGVVLGAHNDTEGPSCVNLDGELICSDPPVFVRTDDPIIHSNYDARTHMHDIALIPLKQKVNFTDYIKAICVPIVTTGVPEFWLSGWGKTETENISVDKLKVAVPRVSNKKCSAVYSVIHMDIRDTQVCAGGVYGKDSCSGDSGGPLMAMENDGTWYAEGIVSFGSGCGREGWPGVYTFLPKYYNWIIDNIRVSKRALGY